MPRRVMEGRVVSDKTNKTVTVLVERRIMDPLYKKFIRRTKKYTAHDEANAFRVGDAVQIEECAPISKTKRFKVISDVPAGDRGKKPVELALVARAEMLAAKPAPVKKAAAMKSVEPKAVKPKPAAKVEPVAEKPVKADKPAKATEEKPAKVLATKAAAPKAAKAKDKDKS